MHYKATVHIREAEHGRYRVWITGPAACEVKASFKARFPEHGARCWNKDGYWTTSLRYRLDEWLSYLRGVSVDWPEQEAESA